VGFGDDPWLTPLRCYARAVKTHEAEVAQWKTRY
jgi:hypothetical protein